MFSKPKRYFFWPQTAYVVKVRDGDVGAQTMGVIVCRGLNMWHRFRRDIHSPDTQLWLDYCDTVIASPQSVGVRAHPESIIDYLIQGATDTHYIEAVNIEREPLPIGNEVDRLYNLLVV